MKKSLQGLFLFLVLGLSALAQDRTITGTVATKEDGSVLVGVSITVKGTSLGTLSTSDGKFSIKLPATAKVLVFKYVGYGSQELSISSASQLNVVLESDSKILNEVVVVGYGTGKKISSVVGSVTVVSGKAFEDRPIANAFDALQGKVAGLQVFTSSGEPSQTSSLRLHGVGSLGASSTPLYLMDGIPIDGGVVVSMNPNDIENISVLKDASATSIYGARAANGVIYITSKRGKLNRPAEINVSTQMGHSDLANEAFFNQFMNTKQISDFWVATAYRTQAQMDAILAQYPFDTKWYKSYYKNGAPTKQTDVSVSGGGGKTTYYVSGSYFSQEGLAYRSGFKRYTLRSNLNTTVNDWVSLGLNLSMGTDDRQTNQYGGNSTNRGLALLAAPFYSPVDKNGVLYPNLIPGWARYNPNYLADNLPSNGNNIQANPSGYIQVTPIKNLTIKSQVGMDAFDYRTSSKQLPSYVGSLNNGSASESFSRGVTKTVTNTVEYKFNIKDLHNITALVGTEYIDNTSTSFSGSSTGQTDDRLTLIGAGPNNLNASSGKSEYAYKSKFSRVEYNFDTKYFLDLSIREDESSRFGKNNRTAQFWSVGAMWKAKKEKIFSNIKWLTDLTFKASTGTSGNSSIGDYQSQALVGTTQFDGGSGWFVSTPGNSSLAWETQQNTTLGVKGSFFNRINLEVELYKRDTRNMLISVPYAYTSGFSSITSNVGTLTNSGIDVTFDFDLLRIDAKKAYITPYLNINYNKNRINELFQGKNYWIIPNTGVSWAIGQPVSYFYPLFSGINPATGQPEWYKPNIIADKIVETQKDANIVTSTFNTAALQQNTGIQRYPWLNGGFGLSGGFQGIYVQADFSFSKGKYMINNDRYFFENPNQFPGFNQSVRVLDYWKKPGDVALFPKYGTQFTQFDSRLIEDASFIRLKTLSVGYNVPESIIKPTKMIKGMKIYYMGRNLLTYTRYLGPDPEVDTNNTLGVNPNTKQHSLGIDFRF